MLVNIFKPGAGLAVPIGGRHAGGRPRWRRAQQHAWDIFLHLFPTSVVDAMARGDILQLVVFSTFFGVGARGDRPSGQPVLDVLESTAQAMFKVTGYVMAFAPIGVFAAIAATVGGKGLAILFTLGKLVALMYVGLALFVLIVVGGVSLLIRVPFLTFVRAIREPFLIAFTTASSEAALPKALEVMERFGVPEEHRRASCCRPATASTSTARRCICRWRASSSRSWPASHMTFGQQLVMMLTLMLTSKGVAGVPRGGARGADRDAHAVRPAARRRRDSARHRSDHGHGTHGRERDGQLHRHGGRRALGRRVRRLSGCGRSPRTRSKAG